jgi:hypothetical protein
MSSVAFAACGNYSGVKLNAIPAVTNSVRLRHRNGVHLATGIAFTFAPECRSPSYRNRVRIRPDSSEFDSTTSM